MPPAALAPSREAPPPETQVGGHAPAGGACVHCGAALECPDDRFCCGGCEAASEIVRAAGLEAYYAEREACAPRPTTPSSIDWEAVPVETTSAGLAVARLTVDGLRCASCVWLAENVLQRTPGVERAHISYATGGARVEWDEAKTSLREIAQRVEALGYQPRILGDEAQPDRSILVRLGVAAFSAANVMMLSVAVYAGWADGMAPRFLRLFQWWSLALATPVALFSAQPFFAGALRGLRARTLHMDLPISIAIAVLFGHALIAVPRGGDAYLDSLTMLVALLLAGRLLETGGRRRASEAALALAASAPRSARRIRGDGIEQVSAATLVPGDRIQLANGEEVSADGCVVAGSAFVRQSLVTGEAAPVSVGVGGSVFAGSVLTGGALEVEVEAAGSATLLGRMAAALADAVERSEGAGDRLAPWFTGITLLVAGLAFLAWSVAAGVERALPITVAVLVVACPCALALSKPLAAASGLGAAARRGILFRSAEPLLALNSVDTVAIDKTGTATRGELTVTEASDDALRVAAGLERYSSHPIALAIVEEALRREIPLPRAQDVQETPGRGIEGWVDGSLWTLRADGPASVSLRSDSDAHVLRLGDRVRADSRAFVQALAARGLHTTLLSGDHRDVADRVGQDIGVAETIAPANPEEKAAWIRARTGEGRRVLFVGDGVNDGPALGAAHVGVAMSGGAASSVLVADAIVTQGSLRSLLGAFLTAQATESAMRRSRSRSVAYNIVAVGAAAAGWVNPLVAAILMPLSSAMVVFEALRIERVVKSGETRAASVTGSHAP